MEIRTFADLRNAFFRHYQEGEYDRVAALVEEHFNRFPERASMLYNWHMCAASLQGQYEKAEQIFAEAVREGHWWAEDILRGDPDLAPMQGRPGFERLVEISSRRHRQALAAARPELLTLLPDPELPGPYPLLLAIHGRGQSAQVAAPRWRSLTRRGWIVALPQSSYLTWDGGYAWEDRVQAESEITAHYRALAEKFTLEPGRVLLAGFSQGGGLAISLALKQSIPAAGFLSVAPFLAGIEDLEPFPRLAEEARPRGYLITGGQDLGQEHFGQIEDLLHEYGISYQREEHPDLGHDFPEDWDEARQRAVRFLLDR